MEDQQQQDPFEKALERLRNNPEFHVLIEDLRERREEKFTEFGQTTDPQRQQQIVGEMTVLHDMASVYEG